LYREGECFLEQSNKKLEQKNQFSISSYLLYLILPKISFVYGDMVTSVYLHLQLNAVIKSNFGKICFLDYSKISEKTGYHPKLVQKSLKSLEKIGLIDKGRIEKTKVYKLTSEYSFFEKTLRDAVGGEKKESIEKKVKQIDALYKDKFIDFPETLNLIDKIELLYRLHLVEKTHRGSSVFYLMLMVESMYGKRYLSEQERAIMVGTSQSTISRYLCSYEKEGMIIRVRVGKKSAFEMMDLPTIKRFETIMGEKVVNIMKNNVYCPICNEAFNSPRSLSMHIAKSSEETHKNIAELKRKNNFTSEELLSYIDINKEEFLKQFKESKKEKKVTHTVEVATTNGEVDFGEKKTELNCSDLINYFYKKIGGKPSDYGKEGKLVKRVILNYELDSEKMKNLLDYVASKGKVNLSAINHIAPEYLMEETYKEQQSIEGTASYLWKKFYDGIGLPINAQSIIKEVAKVKESIEKNGYEATEKIIDYMVSVKCNNIHFLANMRNEALSNNKGGKSSKSDKNADFKNNDCMFDKGDEESNIKIIKDKIFRGRKKICDVEEKYRKKATDMAKKMLVEKKYLEKYTGFEWAWRVGLELDFEMYQSACATSDKETFFEYSLRLPNVEEEMVCKIKKHKEYFDEWVKKQHNIFSSFTQNAY
jgi:DNA-binding MarR family transcriptional regulator